LAVKINGNRGAQQEISVSTKGSKEIEPFQQGFPNLRMWCKKWSNWTSGVGQKNPIPTSAPQTWLRHRVFYYHVLIPLKICKSLQQFFAPLSILDKLVWSNEF